jgi:hypothetical protein
MPSDKLSLTNHLQQSKILCFALIAGQMFFAAVVIYLINFSGMVIKDTGLNEIFIMVVPTIALGSIFGSFVVFKSRMIKIKEITDISTKLNEYRGAQIVRWALYEGPSFFSIIAYMLTGQIFYLGITLIAIILFVATFPSKDRLMKDLELTWEDENQLGE